MRPESPQRIENRVINGGHMAEEEDVKIDEEAIEAHQYFAVLKENVKNVDADALQKQLSIVAEYLILAKALGQKILLNQMAFTHDVIVRGNEAPGPWHHAVRQSG